MNVSCDESEYGEVSDHGGGVRHTEMTDVRDAVEAGAEC